jgi:hypothetical protein
MWIVPGSPSLALPIDRLSPMRLTPSAEKLLLPWTLSGQLEVLPTLIASGVERVATDSVHGLESCFRVSVTIYSSVVLERRTNFFFSFGQWQQLTGINFIFYYGTVT